MNDTKPCCPNCRSTDLRIVGCVLLGPEGVPITESVTPELLLKSDFAVTRELVRCEECTHRSTLNDARAAADLPTVNVLWEDTDQGIKRPVVCPKCQNAENFVKESIRATREAAYVSILDGELTSSDPGGDPELLSEVCLRYVCAQEECDGIVELRSADYVLAKA